MGRSVDVDYQPHSVVGVMPAEFVFPDRETQAWIPAYIAPVHSDDGSRISLQILVPSPGCARASRQRRWPPEGTGRARDTRDPGTAALALFGSAEPPTITAAPALDVVIAEVRPAIRVLLAAVLCSSRRRSRALPPCSSPEPRRDVER